MLLAGDIGLGLLLTAIALIRHQHRTASRRSDEFGAAVTAILASFGLAALLVEGLLPGFWMIGGYVLHGGALEDSLLPGASVGRLLVTLAIGLVISTYASVRAYLALLPPKRTSRSTPKPPAIPPPPT